MCNAKSENENEISFESAMATLENNPNRIGKPKEELRKFRNKKAFRAHHILCKQKGTKGKHGSSLAESNHSSVLAFLNTFSESVETKRPPLAPPR